MTYYQSELKRIKRICHSNQGQINTVIGTRNYIDNNFKKNLNLDLLSRIFFTSKYHLLRLYKRFYGQTPKQYLIEKRLEKSKEFLANGMTANETCFAVGFGSPGSFTTLFKKRIGLTPSEYKKEQLLRSEMNLNFLTCSHH